MKILIPSKLSRLFILTNGATASLSPGELMGQIHRITGAYQLNLPTAEVGLWGRFIATTAAVYSIGLVTGTDIIILNGVNLTAGNKATSDGTIRNEMFVFCDVVGYWAINSILGVMVDGGAS